MSQYIVHYFPYPVQIDSFIDAIGFILGNSILQHLGKLLIKGRIFLHFLRNMFCSSACNLVCFCSFAYCFLNFFLKLIFFENIYQFCYHFNFVSSDVCINKFLNLSFILFVVNFIRIPFNNCYTKFQKHCKIFFVTFNSLLFNLFIELNRRECELQTFCECSQLIVKQHPYRYIFQQLLICFCITFVCNRFKQIP